MTDEVDQVVRGTLTVRNVRMSACTASPVKNTAFLHAWVVELAKHVVVSLAPATLGVGLVLRLLSCGLRCTRCLLRLLGVSCSRGWRRWWCLIVILLRLTTRSDQLVDAHTSSSIGGARTVGLRRDRLRVRVRRHSWVVASRGNSRSMSVWRVRRTRLVVRVLGLLW